MPSCRVRINESLNITVCYTDWRRKSCMPSSVVVIHHAFMQRAHQRRDIHQVGRCRACYGPHPRLRLASPAMGRPLVSASAASGSSTLCFRRRAICQFFDRHSATVRFCGGASWPRRSRHHGPKALTRLVHSPAAYAARLAKRVNEELSSFRSESMRKKRVRAARK